MTAEPLMVDISGWPQHKHYCEFCAAEGSETFWSVTEPEGLDCPLIFVCSKHRPLLHEIDIPQADGRLMPYLLSDGVDVR